MINGALGSHQGRKKNRTHLRGFTLLEVILAVTIVGLLLGLAIPTYQDIVSETENDQAITDIKQLELRIQRYFTEKAVYPNNLAELGDVPLDPWGNAYRYLNIQNTKGKGKLRKDRNLVPINNDYDLYSMGPDGRTASPLTAKISRDDIVRANNGGFVGPALDY
jgi:general secretion pathway protein G